MRNATTTSLEPHEYATQYRTLLSIVWSCVTTIFLCIWVTMHPNMPEPINTRRLGRAGALVAQTCRFISSRLPTFLCALFVPEWVLGVSILQFRSAYRLKRRLPGISLKHAFFIIMGGYHRFERGIRPPNDDKIFANKDYDIPLHPLDPFDVERLLLEGRLQLIPSNELDDKCKGDWVAKLLFTSQIIWFFVQCIGRVLQRLPLTELETITFAYTMMNLTICLAWWRKPYQVSEPARFYDHLPTQPCIEVKENMTNVLHMLYAHITGNQDTWTVLRMRPSIPAFYTGRSQYPAKDHCSSTTLILALSAVAFGLPHIQVIIYPSFSSPLLRLLWNMATIFLCVAPLIIMLPSLLSKSRKHKTITPWIMILSAIILPSIYVMCRLITLVIAGLSLRNLPPKAYRSTEWSRFFPHI